MLLMIFLRCSSFLILSFWYECLQKIFNDLQNVFVHCISIALDIYIYLYLYLYIYIYISSSICAAFLDFIQMASFKIKKKQITHKKDGNLTLSW